MSSSTAGIEIETKGLVRTITFARPERRNGMDLSMFAAYYDALAEAEADDEVRAIVVTGARSSFCSGATPDLLAHLAGSETQQSRTGEGLSSVLGHPAHLPLTMGTPLIAAINGSAAGLGLVHALFADVRFMAHEAQVSAVFSRFGLIAEYGAAWLLPRIVGVGSAMDMLLSSRAVGAEEALRIGLVQHTAPRGEVLGAAQEYARELAESCSPSSMAIIKRQILDGLLMPAADAVAESVSLMQDSFERPDFPEAMAALRERRKPAFSSSTTSAATA
ncbi:enoyl-CoA hydratase [Streptomyces hygroscopicus]|uniref:enoyl-CoA hydratase-related protein n=1 Tax=Streptomyces hygroscopicus TaxID=1912 RepID=UPI0022407540|nr:enoyl-CoA hydratase-related protein [Streptomyces hygroscopicus]MCW7946025.1 enoyl-CoA hydratase [Streptomyces hygroscopicus]